MTKIKSGTPRAQTNKNAPQAPMPHGPKRPAPAPRMSMRPRGSAKGR
jgi:hypothetical protein